MRIKIIKWIMYFIFPAIFNVMFFMLGGTNHPASVWLSYGWIHFAYLLMVSTPLFSRKTQSNSIFQFTIGQISSLYCGLEFIIGLIFIFIATDNIKVPIIIQLIPFCLFLFVFLWNLLHNEHTANSEARRAQEVEFIKSAAAKAKILMDATTDSKIKNQLENVYDLIHSSPTKSYSGAKDLENNVIVMLNSLSALIIENKQTEIMQVITQIQLTMAERNRVVMLFN